MSPASEKTEEQLLRAVRFHHNHPQVFLTQIAREFAVPITRLRARVRGRGTHAERPTTGQKLSDAEEAAICHYVDMLDSQNLTIQADHLRGAANFILKQRAYQASKSGPPLDADIPCVGKNWVYKFKKRHGYNTVSQQSLDANRSASEDPDRIRRWFESLREVTQERGIQPTDTWNMDETGFQIGEGKNQPVITRMKHKRLFSCPKNRETATAVEAISAAREVVPAFLILKAKIIMAN